MLRGVKSLNSLILAVALSAVPVIQAESVKLTGVHLCCGSCVKGVERATAKIKGVETDVNKGAGTVSLSGSKANLKKAMAALGRAGYYGKSSGELKMAVAKAKRGKVESLTVAGVHLCCGGCVKSVAKALGSVAGVKGNTAAKRAKTFEVSGNFEPQAVIDALAKAGLAARAGK